MVCDPGEVAIVPFPFSDKAETKNRPALVVSERAFNERGNTVMAMITSSVHDPWLGDTEIREFRNVGLSVPCKVRLKLFTLDNRLIHRISGRLSSADQNAVLNQITKYVFSPHTA